MRLEQTFGGTRPNLSFTTTWVKRRVVVEWPAAGPTEHVNAIKYNYASAARPAAAIRLSSQCGTSSAQSRALYGGFMQW